MHISTLIVALAGLASAAPLVQGPPPGPPMGGGKMGGADAGTGAGASAGIGGGGKISLSIEQVSTIL